MDDVEDVKESTVTWYIHLASGSVEFIALYA